MLECFLNYAQVKSRFGRSAANYVDKRVEEDYGANGHDLYMDGDHIDISHYLMDWADGD